MAVTTAPDFDLLDHGLFAEREPWEVFEWLQREAPVYRHPEPDGDGFWCVTKYDDVLHVLKNATLFSSEVGGSARIGGACSPATLRPNRSPATRTTYGRSSTRCSTRRSRSRTSTSCTTSLPPSRFVCSDDFLAFRRASTTD